MKIGELAAATLTKVDTIRYYEREGLLPEAPRSDANYRIYGREHVDRLAFIRHCRSLDMALDEVRILLRYKDSPDEDCGDVNALLDEHIGHVSARIRELQELERNLEELRRRCPVPRDAGHCGILNSLSGDAAMETPARDVTSLGTHVEGAHVRRSGAGRTKNG